MNAASSPSAGGSMELNADFSRRVAAHAARLPWVASPMTEIERLMLDRIGQAEDAEAPNTWADRLSSRAPAVAAVKSGSRPKPMWSNARRSSEISAERGLPSRTSRSSAMRGDRGFESISLQQRVSNEPSLRRRPASPTCRQCNGITFAGWRWPTTKSSCVRCAAPTPATVRLKDWDAECER